MEAQQLSKALKKIIFTLNETSTGYLKKTICYWNRKFRRFMFFKKQLVIFWNFPGNSASYIGLVIKSSTVIIHSSLWWFIHHTIEKMNLFDVCLHCPKKITLWGYDFKA